MKTINHKIGFVILALALNLNSYGFSGGGLLNKTLVQKEIQSQLTLSFKKSGKVEVIFTTDKSGRVNLAIAKTEDKALKKAVEAGFSNMRLSGLKPGSCYSIIVNLKLI